MNKSIKNIYNIYLRSPFAPKNAAIKPMEELVVIKDDIITHKGFEELNEAIENSETKTLLEMLQHRVKADGDRKVFGTIGSDSKISYDSYESLDKQARRLALFLETITYEKEVIGIASENRKEWLIAEYATYYANCINSPVYTTFTSLVLAEVIEKTKMKTIIASRSAATCLVDSVYDKCKSHKFQRIILLDEDADIREKCLEKGIKVDFLSHVFNEYNMESPSPSRNQPTADDLATICFTSGTGGSPKGVELTHKNFMTQLEGFLIGSKKYDVVNVTSEDYYISYLPLAHVLERICVCICIQTGAKIGFSRENRKLLPEDYLIIKPTFVPAVPKVLKVFYDKIEMEVSQKPFLARCIFRLGMKYKIFKQRFGIYDSYLWDKLIFGKIAAKFGGRIRACLCGGSHINEELIKYMQCILSARIFQGYGQTEGLGANALCTFSSTDTSSIGIPFITTQIRLVPLGEDFPKTQKLVLLRGPAITRGYYNNPEATKEAFKYGHGWLDTGDVAELRNNKLYIVGREHDMIKLGNGEYVSPENIEEVLNQQGIKGADDFFMTMKLKETIPVLIVVSKDENVRKAELAERLKKIVKDLAKKEEVNPFLSFANFIFIDKDFSSSEFADGNLVTSTMKKKRRMIAMYFKDKIDEAYKKKDILQPVGNMETGNHNH